MMRSPLKSKKSSFIPQYWTRTITTSLMIGFLPRTLVSNLKSMSNMYISTIRLYCYQKKLKPRSWQKSGPGRALDKCPGQSGRPGSLGSRDFTQGLESRGAGRRTPATLPTLPTSSRCVYSRNLHGVQVTPRGILLRNESRQYPEADGRASRRGPVKPSRPRQLAGIARGASRRSAERSAVQGKGCGAWRRRHGSDKTALFLGGHGGCESSS